MDLLHYKWYFYSLFGNSFVFQLKSPAQYETILTSNRYYSSGKITKPKSPTGTTKRGEGLTERSEGTIKRSEGLIERSEGITKQGEGLME